ncbi:hypothetical protein ACIPM2_32145 [Streptomyces sp. NPDC086081]|uniref:hypothetical protein n=1 Tax=Streptomyces sp. NPDC086081 TaxID=3365749 RepID=UPI0038032355
MPDAEDGLTPVREPVEVRALLERAVPQLTAPADRMGRIRHRVRRRRLRRTAAAAAVALVAAAIAVWPGTGWPPGREPASVPPAATASADTHEWVVRFPDAGNLVLTLPDGWQARTVARTDRPTMVYAATQSLSPGAVEPGCAEGLAHRRDAFACAPLTALERGGAIVSFAPVEAPDTTLPLTATLSPTAALGEACKGLGGRLEYPARSVVRSADGAYALQVSICLGEPSTRPYAADSAVPSMPSASPGGRGGRPDGPVPGFTVAPSAGSPDAWASVLQQVQSLISTLRYS